MKRLSPTEHARMLEIMRQTGKSALDASAQARRESLLLAAMMASGKSSTEVAVDSCRRMVEQMMAEGLEPDTEEMNERLLAAGFTLAQIEEATEL